MARIAAGRRAKLNHRDQLVWKQLVAVESGLAAGEGFIQLSRAVDTRAEFDEINSLHLLRFVHGTGRLTNDTIDRLVAVLDLRLASDHESKGR